MVADFQAEFVKERDLGYNDVFPRDQDEVIDNENLRGYDLKEYPFLNEVPPYLEGYMYVGAQ